MEVLMLKVQSEKVAKHWNNLKILIDRVLPECRDHETRMNCILESLLVDRLELFQFVYKDGNDYRIVAFVILSKLSSIDGTDSNMLVYAINSYTNVGREIIMQGWKLIVKYAKSVGCNAVVAYSDSDSVIKFLEKFGADVSQRYIRME